MMTLECVSIDFRIDNESCLCLFDAYNRSNHTVCTYVYTLMWLLTRRPPTKNDLLMSAEGKLRGVSWGLINDHSLQCFNGTNCKTILCSKMTDVFSRPRAEAKESRGASSFSAFWWTLGDPICDARRSTSCFWLTFRASTWVDIYERWRADRIALW